MNLGDSLQRHVYPSFLMRSPRLIHLLHAWNLLFLQRNRIARKALRRLLPSLPPGSFVLDAGCGDGQHLFSPAKKFPALQFWGIDKHETNVAFCQRYADRADFPAGQFHFFCQNLEELNLDGEFSFVLCIGVLQYVADDAQVLRNFAKALKINGKLVIYVPVNGRTVLPFYRYFFEKFGHYEKSQQRQRIYSPEEILAKTGAAGFSPEAIHFTCG